MKSCWLLVVLSVSACEVPAGPRLTPMPRFDAEAMFGVEHATPASGAPTDLSPFQRALQGSPGAPEPAPATPQTSQHILLSGLLAAEIPQTFDDWRWAAADAITVVVHAPAGKEPDTLIYSETALQGRYPSLEVMRFQWSADPALSEVGNAMSDLLANSGARWGIDANELQPVLRVLTSRTWGGGLGYTSSPDTFTGWRWVGRNEQRVVLRMGASQGRWGATEDAAAQLMPLLDRLGGDRPELAGLSELLRGELHRLPNLEHFAPRAAQQWLGLVELDAHQQVHVAIMCTSPCRTRRELATLLHTLHAPSPAERARLASKSHPEELAKLAAQVGLRLRQGPVVNRDVGRLLAPRSTEVVDQPGSVPEG